MKNEKHALNGIKVVEWSLAITGPWVGKCLGDHGAEVIKIESTVNQDVTRLSVPYAGGIAHPDRSATFLRFNTSKRSITLNLKTDEGKAILEELIAWADVFFNNQRPGAMKRLGLSYERIRKINPSIIAMDISNYGQTGPYSEAGGWGNMTMAMGGHTFLTRDRDMVPTAPGWLATADVIGPMNALVAVLAALDYRRRTGNGMYLDVSQLEALVHFLGVGLLDYSANGRVQQPIGNHDPEYAPHGAYPCRGDDQWCAIAVTSENEWQNLCRCMGDPLWAKEARFGNMASRKIHEDELDRRIGEWTRSFEKRELMEWLQSKGIPAGAVQNIADVLEEDPQVKAHDLYPRIEHPVMGECYHGGWPFLLSKTPTRMSTCPCLGADNDYVLNDILGVGDERFVELMTEGILE